MHAKYNAIYMQSNFKAAVYVHHSGVPLINIYIYIYIYIYFRYALKAAEAAVRAAAAAAAYTAGDCLLCLFTFSVLGDTQLRAVCLLMQVSSCTRRKIACACMRTGLSC